MIADEELARFPDTFNGDDARLTQCIEALLSLDATGTLAPHGIGGHAHGLLSAAMHRLASQSRAAGVQGADLTQEAVAEAMKRWPDAQIAAMSRMKDAAMAAHKLCYEAMLKHPDVDTLGDDGELHKAIHAIVGVDTPNYVASPDHSAGAGGMAPQVDVGTIGHVSRDKTTLTAALMKVGQVEAQRKVGTVADISDEDLLRRAMSNLFPRSIRVPAWSRVSDVFGLGSTYSRQLCVRFGRDPETGKPTALAQPADADAEGAR